MKRALFEGRALGYCEAKKFWAHRCEGGLDLHEVLLKRNDMPLKKQEYLADPRNCVLICHKVHMEHGQTTAFNEAAVGYLHRFFLHGNMQRFLDEAPLKVKHRP